MAAKLGPALEWHNDPVLSALVKNILDYQQAQPALAATWAAELNAVGDLAVQSWEAYVAWEANKGDRYYQVDGPRRSFHAHKLDLAVAMAVARTVLRHAGTARGEVMTRLVTQARNAHRVWVRVPGARPSTAREWEARDGVFLLDPHDEWRPPGTHEAWVVDRVPRDMPPTACASVGMGGGHPAGFLDQNDPPGLVCGTSLEGMSADQLGVLVHDMERRAAMEAAGQTSEVIAAENLMGPVDPVAFHAAMAELCMRVSPGDCPIDAATKKPMPACPTVLKVGGPASDLAVPCTAWLASADPTAQAAADKAMDTLCADAAHVDKAYCDCVARADTHSRYYDLYRAMGMSTADVGGAQCWFRPCNETDHALVPTGMRNTGDCSAPACVNSVVFYNDHNVDINDLNMVIPAVCGGGPGVDPGTDSLRGWVVLGVVAMCILWGARRHIFKRQ